MCAQYQIICFFKYCVTKCFFAAPLIEDLEEALPFLVLIQYTPYWSDKYPCQEKKVLLYLFFTHLFILLMWYFGFFYVFIQFDFSFLEFVINQADTGSPLVDLNRRELVGIATHFNKYAGFFTNTTKYYNWKIKQVQVHASYETSTIYTYEEFLKENSLLKYLYKNKNCA